MGNNELKDALQNRRPVILSHPVYGEIECLRVNKVIYSINEKDELIVSAELLSAPHSVIIALPQYIRYVLPPT